MADPVFNDFYYLKGPVQVAGNPPDVDFGSPDFEPIGIVVAINTPTPAGVGEWLLLDSSGAIE